jgi:hypothetical protein
VATCGWLQGAAVAIDSAVPRREDAGPMAGVGDPNYPALAAAMNIIDLVRRLRPAAASAPHATVPLGLSCCKRISLQYGMSLSLYIDTVHHVSMDTMSWLHQ